MPILWIYIKLHIVRARPQKKQLNYIPYFMPSLHFFLMEYRKKQAALTF